MVPAMKSVSSRLTMREMSGVSTEPNAQEHALRCLPACVIVEGQELLNTVLNSAPVSPFSLCRHGPMSCAAGCSLSGVCVLLCGVFVLVVRCLSDGLQPGSNSFSTQIR